MAWHGMALACMSPIPPPTWAFDRLTTSTCPIPIVSIMSRRHMAAVKTPPTSPIRSDPYARPLWADGGAPNWHGREMVSDCVPFALLAVERGQCGQSVSLKLSSSQAVRQALSQCKVAASQAPRLRCAVLGSPRCLPAAGSNADTLGATIIATLSAFLSSMMASRKQLEADGSRS